MKSRSQGNGQSDEAAAYAPPRRCDGRLSQDLRRVAPDHGLRQGNLSEWQRDAGQFQSALREFGVYDGGVRIGFDVDREVTDGEFPLNRPDFRSVLQARLELDEQEVFAGDA